MLHGREVERARLRALLEDARSGSAGSLVVVGEPGVGKSALLDDAVSGLTDALVLRTQGLESESPLAFAALHRLLRPVLGRLDRIPSPQAAALRVAFGEESGSVEPFLVGLATLSLLGDAAEERLVVCVVDDAHWLDDASADALLFAARRIAADRIAVVLAARDTEGHAFEPEGVPRLALSGLDVAAVRSLLAQAASVDVASDVVDRLHAETGGNPLAVVELPTGLSAAQLNGSEPLPAQLMLTSGVERVFLDRCRRLGPGAQRVLLVAATDDTGALATVQRAASGLGAAPGDLDEAERSGLLVARDGTVALRHPLVRSAVYQAATANERRSAHLALAEVLAAAGDRERATWHRARAADGPDEDLVAALEEVGRRAESRGGYRSASDAFERAAELSADPVAGARRRFAAARNAWASGQTSRASGLLAAARPHADDPLLLADVDRLRARIAVVGSPGTELEFAL